MNILKIEGFLVDVRSMQKEGVWYQGSLKNKNLRLDPSRQCNQQKKVRKEATGVVVLVCELDPSHFTLLSNLCQEARFNVSLTPSLSMSMMA